MSGAVIEQVKAISEDTSIPLLSATKQIQSILLEAGLAYRQKMLASCVLVHPSHRSKLGLNPYNVHRNGRMIMQIGCDERQLQNAVLFEISRDATTKAKQIAVNQKLIELSGGLLAPLTGMERGLSVGCGHFTAFVRAAQAGCHTHELGIANSDKRIYFSKLRRDTTFAKLLDEGWEWFVISESVEELLPGLPNFFQRALNATNSAASDASELEVASAIAEFYEMGRKSGEAPAWDTCIQAAFACNPFCAPYAQVLAEFSRKFGGGTDPRS